MSLHRCTEAECPFVGQITSRSCRCHKTDLEMLEGAIKALLSADDDMLSFLVSVRPADIGEDEWRKQHKAHSDRSRDARSSARTLVTPRALESKT